MDVYIGNLADAVGEAELEEFLKGRGYPPRWLELVERARRDGGVARYGVASFAGRHTGLAAIVACRGVVLRDRGLLLREYCHRCCGNERRVLDWRCRDWPGVERRLGERRGRGLVPDRPWEVLP